MKTSKMFITIVTALAMASCNNDKEFANQPELEMQVPEAYASFSISIPHTSGTRSVTTRSTEPGTDAENIVKSLHIFIYDKEAPFTSTVAEFSVAANTLQQAPGNTSQWITTRPVNTKKADKYIFAAVNLNTEIVDYITSNGLGAFNYKEFTQEVGKQTGSLCLMKIIPISLQPQIYMKIKPKQKNIIFQYQSAVLLQRVLYSLHLRLK